MYLNTTGEAATHGGRTGSTVQLHQNISYNKVTLKDSNELRSTTTPTGPTSQLKREGEMTLDTSPEGILHNCDVLSLIM